MATLRMTNPWQDPRTGIWMLKKRIPSRYKAVSGQRGDQIKLSTGTADRKEAMRLWPGVLARYAEREAEWERLLNAVAVTPEKAKEIAAVWAAWVAADLVGRLDRAGEDYTLFVDVFEGKLHDYLASMKQLTKTGSFKVADALAQPRSDAVLNTSREERRAERLAYHTNEALKLSGVEATANTRAVLEREMIPVLVAAYRQAALMANPGSERNWNPLGVLRAQLPAVTNSPKTAATVPVVPLDDLLSGWSSSATVKPRTVTETRYIFALLETHLGHKDASKVARSDILAWREASKAGGVTNNTWNNRLSMIRQPFEWAVAAGRLTANPAETTLRLKKSRTAPRLPYTDAEAALILNAARKETRASLRWAPWIMAFTGMRVAEVLQLSAADVRQQDDIWYLAVHEDDAEKSVKTGERRNVPVHPALIAEGLIDYAKSVPQDGPLFPDKKVGQHGTRGERGWNVTGEWVREVVGIKDKAKAPNHSFRHRVEDELRAVEAPEDARDAILGHARKTTGRLYGVRGEALGRLYRYLAKVPVPAGVDVDVAERR